MKAIALQLALVGAAYWVWGHGRAVYNAMVPAPLPHSYFSGGDANTTCKTIKDPILNRFKFCEDAILWGSGSAKRVLVSCDPGRHEWNTVMGPLENPVPQGDIWVYDYNSEQLKRVPLDGYPIKADFHPLGIDIVPATLKEPAYLFAVNHGRDNSTIEQFSLSDTWPHHATHIRTLSHPAFNAPNSVAPISATSFYVSNDHYFTRRLPHVLGHVLPVVESLLAAPLGWVDRVDLVGDEIHVTRAISNIPFANGIALSPDGKQLALSSSTLGAVRLYKRDKVTDELEFEAEVPVPFSTDNISYDERDNSVIAAGHPHFPTLTRLAAQKVVNSPSWVVSVTDSSIVNGAQSLNDSLAAYPASLRVPVVPSHTVATLYQSNGDHFSSSSTGLREGKNVFVSGLYAEGLLHCVAE